MTDLHRIATACFEARAAGYWLATYDAIETAVKNFVRDELGHHTISNDELANRVADKLPVTVQFDRSIFNCVMHNICQSPQCPEFNVVEFDDCIGYSGNIPPYYTFED